MLLWNEKISIGGTDFQGRGDRSIYDAVIAFV
jgi:hypothetical protein